jgi:type I restriction enzyme, S subunit
MAVWSEATTTEILATRRIDAEFSQPKYLEAERKTRSCKVENLGNLGAFVPGPFGSAFRVSNYDFQSPYRYIRGQDVKPFFILEDDSRFIPQADFIRLQHYAVKKDDLMISVVGTLGNVAVCTERETPAMFSCKSTIFRTEKVDPYYLLAYLNAHFGQLCLLRRQRGAIQMGLNIEDLRSIPIPRLGGLEEGRIAEKVRKAHDELISSRESYQSAQQLLEFELGFDKLSLQKPVGYVAQISEVVSEKRMNAEYFSPLVKKILSNKIFSDAKPLTNYFSIIRGQTPKKYLKEGIAVLKTKAIRTPSIDYERVSDFAESPVGLTVVAEGDLILASMGVGSLGRISYANNLKEKCVIDGTLRLLRRKIDAPKNIELPYLLFLSSWVGQELIYRGIIGSTGIISLPDEYLRRIVLPNISDKLCEELTALVISSMEAKENSKKLLNQAKARVEQLIEEAV